MTNTQQNSATKYWAIVPAAGVGRRMKSDIPKQYLQLFGKTVIEHTVERLLACVEIQAIVIAIDKDDSYFGDTGLMQQDRVQQAMGGTERCHSVQNALQVLQDNDNACDDDWVLVHDAARPCISIEDIQAVIDYTKQPSSIGAVLGIPVRDTMKRTNAETQVVNTVERNNLWHAHTPQIFRLGQLQQALTQALAQDKHVTDEASAMEMAGVRPHMLEGKATNIKITLPADLELAKFFLSDTITKS
ncbi:MAG: 2-C-methyl-D-erythritol 4-phosphate cytidylyltransferase [Thiohalomonadales bacterium]